MRRRRPVDRPTEEQHSPSPDDAPTPEDYLSPLWALTDLPWPDTSATEEVLAWTREHAPDFVLPDEQARANRDRRERYAAARAHRRTERGRL